MAGGLAVVAHGCVRFTADVDIILDMDEKNLERTMGALSSLGYRPRAPVKLEEFTDGSMRRSWQEEKGMRVFSLYSSDHEETEIDLFLEPPLDFDQAHCRAAVIDVGDGLEITFLGLDDLISIKRDAGRPQDLADIDALEKLGRDDG